MKLKPHGCSAECGKYFADRASLIKHERNIHGILRKKGISGASKKKPKREVNEVLVKEEDPEIVDLTHCELKRSPTPSLQESADSSREATCTPTTPAIKVHHYWIQCTSRESSDMTLKVRLVDLIFELGSQGSISPS